MKKYKILPLLLISLALAGVGFLSKSVNGGFDEKIVMVQAQNSAEATHFIEVDWAEFRENHKDICNVSYKDYNDIMDKYKLLSDEDKLVVDAANDPIQPEYTIGQMIQELVKTHYTIQNNTQNPQQKLDQSTTITIAVVVSIFGMSAISVLYILKNKKYIE